MITIGTSGKLLSTLYAAVGVQVIALLVAVIATGEFDRGQTAQLVGLALSAVGGFYFGHAAPPDTVVFDPASEVPGGFTDGAVIAFPPTDPEPPEAA